MTSPTYDSLVSRLTPVFTNTGMAKILDLLLNGSQTLHLFKEGPDDPFSYDVELNQFVEANYLGYSHHVIVDPGLTDEWDASSAENGVATTDTNIFQFEKWPDTNTQTILGYFIKDADDEIIFWNIFYAPIIMPEAGMSFNLELFARLSPYTCSIAIEARITSTGGIELGGYHHWAIIGENGIQDSVGGVEVGGSYTSRLINYHAGLGGIEIGAEATFTLIKYYAGGGGVYISAYAGSRLVNYHDGIGGVELGGSSSTRLINYADASIGGFALNGGIVGGTYVLDPTYYESFAGIAFGGEWGYRKVFPGRAGFLLGAEADYWTGFGHASTGGFSLGGEQESEVEDPGGGFTCTGDGNDFSTDRGNWSSNYGSAPTVSGGKLICSITGGTCGAINTTSAPSGDIEFQGECEIISSTISASTQINFMLRFGINNFGGRLYFTGSSPWQFSLTTVPGSAGTTGTLAGDHIYFKTSYDPAGAGPMKIWISDGTTDWGPYTYNLGGGASMTGTNFYVIAGGGESINVQADNFCMTDTRTI